MLIPYEKRQAVYKAAIATNGESVQLWKAIEEMSELTKELAKLVCGGATLEGLVDEIADVTVMMEQLRLIFNVNEAVQDRIDFKVARLADRLGLPREVLE